ncbi:MAG: hypothetical protein ACI86M_001732 [Saprospiraceae bacterium]|jgi:hypothetical protein
MSKMKLSILSLVMFTISFTANGQLARTVLNDLNFYADIIANAGNSNHKQRAHDEFAKIFDEWLISDQFNEEDLESIQWLSVKKPEDDSFTLITWQLLKGENDNHYFGYILKDGITHKLNSSNEDEDLEYNVLGADDWVGVMYYNILTMDKAGKKIYILFGYDAHKSYENRKIADALTFDNGKPIFGYEIFKKQKGKNRGVIKNRLVLDYASDSNVSLNYNPSLDMIVFDHLIPRMGRLPGQGATMLPDGSYVGYKWDGEYFNYVDKIYHQTQAEAPFPKPILGGDNRNIMGKNKKVTKKRKN